MPHRTIRLQLGLICIALLASPHPKTLRAATANESKDSSAAKLSPPDSKEVCPDMPLRIDFPTAPSIAIGKITVFDASNEAPRGNDRCGRRHPQQNHRRLSQFQLPPRADHR